MKTRLLPLVASLLISGVAMSQSLVRGPYLQSVTETSIKIMWRTDVAANSEIWIGTAVGSQALAVLDTAQVINHTVFVGGLSPDTKYYYTVKSNGTTLGGGDEWHHFKTAQVQGSTQPFRFWALGDFGKRNDCQRNARNAFIDYTASQPADFWIWLGDNAYDTGKDHEYQDKVFDRTYAYDSIFRYLPFYPSPGNHDYGSVDQFSAVNHRGPYYDMVEVFKNGELGGEPSGTENYYSYNRGNVHFVSLNTEIYGEIANPATSRMRRWLEDDLAANTQPWTIIYFHESPYSRGSHNSDDGWEIFLAAIRMLWTPIFESYGVDIVIYGHSHVYERTSLIKGHTGKSWTFDPAVHAVQYRAGDPDVDGPYIKYTYGDSANVGTVYVVSGNGGSSESEPLLNHKAMIRGDGGSGVCGSMIFDVVDTMITVKYLKSDGTIGDQFAMVKRSIPTVVKELDSDLDFLHIYPNPTKDKILIEWSLKQSMKLDISLLDISGKLMANITSENFSRGNNSVTVDLKKLSLPDGQYLVNFKSADGKVLTRSVVKASE